MNSFALSLLDSQGSDQFAEITQFIGADAGGSFGLLAGHQHMLAILRYGLARFSDSSGAWYYLAMPGGVLRFIDNTLTVTTLRYFLGTDRELICRQLADEMAQLDSEIHSTRATLAKIEHSLLQRLVELSKQQAGYR